MRTRPSSSLLATFALVALVAAARPTAAADPTPGAAPAATSSPAQQADELFLKGKALLKEGKKQDALAAYRAAFNLRKSYDVAGNLGSLELDLGLHRDAAEHMAYALSHYAASGTTQDQLAKAKQRFETARKEVCVVHVAVSVAGAEVFVDGVSIGRAPIAEDVFVAPGARKIEARYPGYVTATKSVDAKKGGTEEVTLEMEREAAPVPTATATASATATVSAPPPPRSMVPAYVLGGVGIASLLTGGVLIGVAESTHATLKADAPRGDNGQLLCRKTPGGAATTAECDAWRAKSATASTGANAALGLLVGGGLAVAGAAVYWLWAAKTPPISARSWTVMPVVGGGAGGVVWTGNF